MEHSSQDFYEMHVIVRGKVQGIGFRALTNSRAHRLGLKGTVRNLPDGTVEIFAQGSKSLLTDFIQQLKQDTLPGQIEETSMEFFPIKDSAQDFSIIN